MMQCFKRPRLPASAVTNVWWCFSPILSSHVLFKHTRHTLGFCGWIDVHLLWSNKDAYYGTDKSFGTASKMARREWLYDHRGIEEEKKYIREHKWNTPTNISTPSDSHLINETRMLCDSGWEHKAETQWGYKNVQKGLSLESNPTATQLITAPPAYCLFKLWDRLISKQQKFYVRVKYRTAVLKLDAKWKKPDSHKEKDSLPSASPRNTSHSRTQESFCRKRLEISLEDRHYWTAWKNIWGFNIYFKF